MATLAKVPIPVKYPTFPLRSIEDWYEFNTSLNYQTFHKSFPISNGYESNHLGVVKSVFRKQAPLLEASHLNKPKQIKWFTEKLPVNSDSVVLDLCCGTGVVARQLSSSVKQVHGVDISKHLIDFAKTKPGENVEYHRADATTLPFPDNSFDVAFSRLSFNHILERLEVLNEMRRVCKPGGHIALLERVIPDEITEEASVLMEHLEEVRDHSHVYFMTPAEMNQNFKEHNIEVTTKETTTCSEPFEQYLNQTGLTQKDRDFISQFVHSNLLLPEEEDKQITGFYPHIVDDVLFVTHHLAMIGGTNPVEKPKKE